MRHQNQCRAPHEKQYALPSWIQLSVLEDCSGYCSVGYDKYPVAWHWEGDSHCAPSCVVACCHCDSKKNAGENSISDQNWVIITANRLLQQVESHGTPRLLLLQMNQRMNEHQSLLNFALAASLSPLDSPLKFLLVTKDGSWKNDPWPSPDLQTSEKKLKQNSNNLIFRYISYIFVKSVWISLPINAKKPLWGNTSFLRFAYFCSSLLEINNRSFFHLYRSEPLFYSRCAPFRAWKRSQARPKSAENRSPLSAVSSTCKEITWDKCYGSVRLALFTASLAKKCVVWNYALGKWQCLHNETTVTRSIWIQAETIPISEVW